MINPVELYTCYGVTFKGSKHDPAKGVSDGYSETGFKRPEFEGAFEISGLLQNNFIWLLKS